MELLLALAILALVAAFVTAPLRRSAADGSGDPPAADRAELEARKLVLYREIRDAESDRASGKLNQRDFERLDGELRAEAIDVLKQLDRLAERAGAEKPDLH